MTSAALAAPKTIQHVPLFVEVSSGNPNSPTYTYVPVAEFNKTLIQKGQPAQLEFVDLDVTTKFDNYANRDKLDAAIQAAGISNTQAFGEYVPANWGDKDNYTCYRGDGKGVIDIVQANTDNLYSDQYVLLAWRLGKKVVMGEGTEYSPETQDTFNENSEAWKNYDKKSDTVVILASVGDGGDDVQESVIPRCK
jgi:hypothetical protein